MSSLPALQDQLDGRLISRCEEIPADPAPGNYVVIDVLHFSNTAIELLANGAAYVHITEERGQEFAVKRANPSTRIGGGRTDDFEPTVGYDFFNSPSYVQRLDIEGKPASLWSSNGGRAVVALRERRDSEDDVHVYVGSTLNARPLADHLRETGRPTYLVGAGSNGDPAVEDLVGATLIGRHLDGSPPTRTELEQFRRQIKIAKGIDYIEKHPVRRRDVCEYAMNVNGRSILPKLSGNSLIAHTDAGATGTPHQLAAD